MRATFGATTPRATVLAYGWLSGCASLAHQGGKRNRWEFTRRR
jgi:hypothetical protein